MGVWSNGAYLYVKCIVWGIGVGGWVHARGINHKVYMCPERACGLPDTGEEESC